MNRKGKIITRIITGATAFVASIATAYFLTPNKVKELQNSKSPTAARKKQSADVEDQDSNFMRFVTRLTKETGIKENETKEYYGFNVEFENLGISFKKDGNYPENNISVEGGLDFMMKGLKNINFNLYADIDYNGYKVPVDIGYVDKTAYLGFNDLRLKMGSTTWDELLGNEEEGVESLLYKYFVAKKEDGGINFNIEKFYAETYNKLIDGLLGSIDFSKLTSSFKMGPIAKDETGVGLVVVESETNDGYEFKIDLTINKENPETSQIDSTPINIVVDVDKEHRLTYIDLGKIELGNFKIEGALRFTAIKEYAICSPENVNFVKYNANNVYVEVINYKGWLQKLAKFLDEDNQKIGLDFDLALNTTSNNSLAEIGSIEGSINADFSELIDLSNYVAYEEEVRNTIKRGNKVVDDILNKASFGLELKFLSKTNEEYGNLAIKYKDGEGYIDLNESLDSTRGKVSVMKAKVDTETFNWLLNELPDVVTSLSEDKEATDNLFSFITDSNLVKGIKDGNYSVILELLKGISNDENTINVNLDLSTLGLGDNAQASIVLDSRVSENSRVLNLSLDNIEVGSLNLDADIASSEFKSIVVDNTDAYDSLSFLPTVVDQVSSILDTKQAGFAISGSILDADNVGITLNGQGQFDYGNKYGFGTMTIDEYKYKNKGVWYSHKLAIDVDNTTGDFVKNSAYFIYGDPSSSKNVKGKVTVQSVLDLIDIVKTFINDSKEDPRWSKFLEPILRMMSMSELSNIINSNDYFRFLKNDLIKSINKTNDRLSIVIGGEIFSLQSDINIFVNFKNDKIDSLEVSELVLSSGKVINLKLEVKDFDSSRVSPVDKSASYMDLSTIATLLKFGINTTKNSYYHLSADIEINALGFFTLDTFRLEVYIVVDGEYCKIYGVIPDALISSVAQEYTPIYTKSLVSEFTFETYADTDPNKADGVGGYFHFKTTKKEGRIFPTTTIKHFKTTGQNLLEGNNLMTYLLRDFLCVRSTLMSGLNSITFSNSNSEKDPGDFTNTFTSTGYKFDEKACRWDIGLNLNELTGISALKDLEVKIYGGNNEKFTKLWLDLNIANILDVEATIKLEDVSSSVTTWSNDIESSFTSINNVSFPESKLNQPNEYIGN